MSQLEVQTIDRFLASWRKMAALLRGHGRTLISRGIVGELLVWRRLLTRGVEAQYFGGGKADFDIKTPEFTLDCKEKTGTKWVRLQLRHYWTMPEVKPGECQRVDAQQPKQPNFYVFVDLQHYVATGESRFYVFQRGEFCDYARKRYDFSPRPKNANSSDFWLRQDADLEHYRDDKLDRICKPQPAASS
jgi:hypothetical protein